MMYDSPKALRDALEHRLREQARASDVSVDRLRRRVIFQRFITRLQHAEPGQWVLKGGMALDVRLGDSARATKDIDFGLRDGVTDAGDLRDRLIDALAIDADGDGFLFEVAQPEHMAEDGDRQPTWRVPIAANLAGRTFGGLKVDVSPRVDELRATEFRTLPNSFAFAGFEALEIEIIDIHRHAAEKLHAMSLDFGDRENTRVRDLVDLMLLADHDLLETKALAAAVTEVWLQREGTPPPASMVPLPVSWHVRYERFAEDYDVDPPTFPAATARASDLWASLFTSNEI